MRVSVSTLGEQANGLSSYVDISENGRFVVFTSFASNLVAGDTNGESDIFLHDRDADGNGLFDEPGGRSTVRVNARPGLEPNGQSFVPKITPDGRYIVFSSAAGNLVSSGQPTLPHKLVFRADRLTGDIVLVSQNNAGQAADHYALDGSISDDGRFVVFVSFATNLADDPGSSAIYLRDMEARTTTKLSVRQLDGGPDGAGGFRFYSVGSPTISGDGQLIAFAEQVQLIDAQSRSFWSGALTLVNRTTGETRRQFAPGWQVSLTRDGTAFVACGTEAETPSVQSPPYWQHIGTGERRTGADRPTSLPCIEGASRSGRYVQVRDGNGFSTIEDFRHRSKLPTPFVDDTAFSAGDQVMAFSSGWSNLLPPGQDTNGTMDVFVQPVSTAFDNDSDSLDDGWERAFGLSTFAATGVAGPAGDIDGDGLTNAQELAAGSHPNGHSARYLAEGATGAFFETRIALANRDATQTATAVVRFEKGDGTASSQIVPVPPRGRSSVVARAAGIGTTDFATVVESDIPLVVDRLMTWDERRYGSHAETSVETPAPRWFLAEGTTVLGFQLFYLLQNPQATATTATVRFLRPAGAPILRSYDLPPRSRTTIYVNTVPELDSTDVSAEITGTQPIVVERAMYRTRGDEAFALGHAASGIRDAAASWFLAEGATGTFFDTYVLIANPSPRSAAVTMDFLRDDGGVVHQTHTVAPNSRFSVFVDGVAGLEDTTFGTRVTSTEPVVVERAMYWSGGFFDYYEGHVSAASTATGSAWVLAEGEVGGAQGAETYVLIANTAPAPVSVTVRALPENPLHSAPLPGGSRQLTIAANSRVTVPLSELVTGAARSAVEVVETGPSLLGSLVVEGAIYWHAGEVVWAAGAALPATRIF